MHTLRQKCKNANALVHARICNGAEVSLPWNYCELILSLARASCRLSLPPAQLLSRLNQLPDARRSRNPSRSTLAHDAVAAAVSQKHHWIICVGAGLIQFVYKSHPRLATELTLNKVIFLQWFSRAFFPTIQSYLLPVVQGLCSSNLFGFEVKKLRSHLLLFIFGSNDMLKEQKQSDQTLCCRPAYVYTRVLCTQICPDLIHMDSSGSPGVTVSSQPLGSHRSTQYAVCVCVCLYSSTHTHHHKNKC